MNKILKTLVLGAVLPLSVESYDFNKKLNFLNQHFNRDYRKIMSKWENHEAYVRTTWYNISDDTIFINPCFKYEWFKNEIFWIQRFCSKIYTEDWTIRHKTDLEHKFIFEKIHTELRNGIILEEDFHPQFIVEYTQIRIYLDDEFEKLYLNLKYNYDNDSSYIWLEFRFKKDMY